MKPSKTASCCALLVLALALALPTRDALAKVPFAPNQISDVAERVTPAVVSITASRRAAQIDGEGRGLTPMLRDLFPDEGRVLPQTGLGSGVIISPDGEIVTNNHVVEDADEIRVTLSDQRELPARVLGVDKASDLAFLKIDGKGLPHLALGDSARLRLGELVLAVGNPYNIGQTVTMGIVSAKGRADVGLVDYEDFIQTDAAINLGNSGGALVNLSGELVGINTAIFSRTGGSQGIGFAVPSNMVRPIRDQIAEFGRVRRGWLGVAIQDLSPDLARSLDLTGLEGVLVSDVVEGGPAARTGLSAGDVVVAVDGRPTRTVAQLRNRIALTRPGTKTTLSVIRAGAAKNVVVKLAEKDEEGVIARLDRSAESLVAGLGVTELNAEMRRRWSIPSRIDGVIVTQVERGSPADRAGIEAGNLISTVNGRSIRTPGELLEAVPADAKEALLRIFRRGMFQFVVLRH